MSYHQRPSRRHLARRTADLELTGTALVELLRGYAFVVKVLAALLVFTTVLLAGGMVMLLPRWEGLACAGLLLFGNGYHIVLALRLPKIPERDE